LSLSTDTIYRMASMKKLPYLKIGDRVLFDIKALDRWIEKHMIKEKEWKREELRAEIEQERPNAKTSKESDLLGLLKRKGKD
ncbi:MAG: helix-turn-helix domain-containing protein, partial [Thermodesulfobacteriota bacterium]|nr:helix-turn-helix domain-containing protein [Thermodesulfobacteriota bacterium]